MSEITPMCTKHKYHMLVYDDPKYYDTEEDKVLSSLPCETDDVVLWMKDTANFCDAHGLMSRASKVELVDCKTRKVIGLMTFNNNLMNQPIPNPNIIKSLIIEGYDNITLERLPMKKEC